MVGRAPPTGACSHASTRPIIASVSAAQASATASSSAVESRQPGVAASAASRASAGGGARRQCASSSPKSSGSPVSPMSASRWAVSQLASALAASPLRAHAASAIRCNGAVATIMSMPRLRNES